MRGRSSQGAESRQASFIGNVVIAAQALDSQVYDAHVRRLLQGQRMSFVRRIDAIAVLPNF